MILLDESFDINKGQHRPAIAAGDRIQEWHRWQFEDSGRRKNGTDGNLKIAAQVGAPPSFPDDYQKRQLGNSDHRG